MITKAAMTAPHSQSFRTHRHHGEKRVSSIGNNRRLSLCKSDCGIIDVIFFDLDGTLLDDEYAVQCGLDSLYSAYGHLMAHSRENLSRAWQRLSRLYYPGYLRGELTIDEQRRQRIRGLFVQEAASVADSAIDRIFATYLKGYETGWRCFDDVIPVLRVLQAGSLGIITNGDLDQQTRKLNVTGLLPFFEIVVTSGELGIAKPKPEIFLEACARAGPDAATCTYVGDSWDTDVLGSRRAGLRAVWLRRDGTDGMNTTVPPPDVVTVRAFAELLALQFLHS